MIALWGVAAWHRLKVLNETVIGSDSLGPYLQAQAALFGHMPRPPNPESGDALWVSMLPLVGIADTLSGLFALRFIVGLSLIFRHHSLLGIALQQRCVGDEFCILTQSQLAF